MDKYKFVFDNYNNSSHLSSVLIALFYNNKLSLELNKSLNDPINIYIQKFIKFNIIDKMIDGKTINYSSIKEFLLILKNNNYNYDKKCIFLFYEFIQCILEFEEIKYNEHSLLNNNIIKEEKTKYIELNLDLNLRNNNVKNLLDNWILNNNKIKEKNKNNLDIIKITNFPKIIAIKINRNTKDKLNQIDLIINKKICLFNFSRNYDLEKIRWNISAIVCKSINKNNYYSVFKKNNKWFLFNDLNIPCLEEMSMANNLITNKIKKESCLLFYILDKN